MSISPNLRDQPRTPLEAWHALPIPEVLVRLDAATVGLSEAQAQERLARHGPNLLPRAAGESVLALLWRQLNNPLIIILLGAALLAFILGKVVDALVVLGAVVVNVVIGFVQEYRASKAIEALTAMVPETATVIRQGERRVVAAAELVPGDIILLQAGDKVPADVRLLEQRNLRIGEAVLTGESVPVEKSTEAVSATVGIGDRRNMAYSGTLVKAGTGRTVVVATGGHTELGRISAMLGEATELQTPLTKQLAKIGKVITVAVLVVASLLVVVGLLRGYTVGDAALAAIILAVGAIPEGLPAIVTIALAVGVQRMARRRAVIRYLPAVETLGSTTVICTDKTGTLTRNEMTVQALWTPLGSYALSGVGYAPEGGLADSAGRALDTTPANAQELLLAGALCNDASLRYEDGRWQIQGDPTEAALIVAAHKRSLTLNELQLRYPRLDAIPFASEHQFMATLHAAPEGKRVAFLKGAPEVVLRRCEQPNLDREAVLREVERLASQGMRVLAFAEKPLPTSAEHLMETDVKSGLVFLGLQGMIDPPRPEAIAAVKACHQAGIAVKMITGDHQATAQAIGRELGLTGEAISGAELERLSDQQLRQIALAHNIFARVSPEHKLRLVKALQAEGGVVAMTGDGVNDAPALKQANIGVAMGITGTAVTKEAADIIITDDNFASIAAAVEEGRRIYDNLIKALAFVLPTNLGLAVIFTVAVAFFPVLGGEALLPMLPTQILWINLVASATLGLTLAFEVLEPGAMRRPPRRPDAPVLSRFIVVRTALVALLMAAGAVTLFLFTYFHYLETGVPAEQALREAQTMAVTTVILFQIFYLLNCRSLRDSVFQIGLWSNPWIYFGIGLLLLLQLGFIYLPFMNTLFRSTPLDAQAWFMSVLAALIIFPVITLEKWWRQRLPRTQPS